MLKLEIYREVNSCNCENDFTKNYNFLKDKYDKLERERNDLRTDKEN